MSVVYGQLAAKQAAAKVKSASGKRQYEYDSDEDTEGGRFSQGGSEWLQLDLV